MDISGAVDLTQQSARYAQPPKLNGTSDPSKARETAESFEAFFIGQYIEQMYTGIKTDGMFGGGQGESVFRSMMLQEYGKIITQAGGIGIADSVQKAILEMQEKADSATQQPEQSK